MKFTIQKASLWKRFSALLFDVILTVVLATGFSAVSSAIFGYDKLLDKSNTIMAQYEEEYGVDFQISSEDYEKLTETEKNNLEEARKQLALDEEYFNISNSIFMMTLGITSSSCFLAILIWDFLIPLLLGYGRTLGKKIFGTAVIRTNGVKATNPVLFIRAMIGSFAIETMFPLFLVIMILFSFLGGVGIITLAGFYILQIIAICATQTNSPIHDLLCDTVVVEMDTQLIFETEEERVDFIRRQQEEEEREAFLSF